MCCGLAAGSTRLSTNMYLRMPLILIGSVKYTSTNIAQMVVGLIFWLLALGICVVNLVLMVKG